MSPVSASPPVELRQCDETLWLFDHQLRCQERVTGAGHRTHRMTVRMLGREVDVKWKVKHARA